MLFFGNRGIAMATFLKIVSVIYLIVVWISFAVAVGIAGKPPMSAAPFMNILAFLIAVSLSIPAAVLFAFAQVVEDVRSMRTNIRTVAEDIRAVRQYYEQNQRQAFDQ